MTAVADAAQDCPQGFTEGDYANEGNDRTVGSVAHSSGTRVGGGDWVGLDFAGVEALSGDTDASLDHEYHYFFRYGNAVVHLVNGVGQNLRALGEDDLNFLYDQIVSHLQGADR
jgi:hypothetical protein